MKRFTLKVTGDGLEIVMERINEEQYQYWRDNIAGLRDYARDSMSEFNVDEDFAFISPAAWYDCDNVLHENIGWQT